MAEGEGEGMKNMDVQDIVDEWLKANGYSGLYCPGECACKVGNLFPCGYSSNDCYAGYEIPCDCGDHDFHIGPTKPKQQEGDTGE